LPAHVDTVVIFFIWEGGVVVRVEKGIVNRGVQGASDREIEARETYVNADDELIAWVEACDPDDDLKVLSPVGGRAKG